MSGPADSAILMASAGLGALVGWLQLRLLSWNIRALLEGDLRFVAIGAPFARFCAAAAAFGAMAALGAAPLVAGLAGFMVLRTVLVRRRGLLP